MRLDNRTQALHISGEAFSEDGSRERIKTYFAGTGGTVEDVRDGFKVVYPNRAVAEKVRLKANHSRRKADRQVMAQGTNELPEYAGKINATWYQTTVSYPTNGNESTEESGAHHEVEMSEETHRGEREDDE